MKAKPALIGFLILVITLLACGGTTPTPGLPATEPPTIPATESPVLTTGPFTISIEYGVPGLADAYAASGVTYVKPMPGYGIWGNIEHTQGEYQWGPADAVISQYQAAGFTGIQLLITAESAWASRRQPTFGDKGDSFPKEEYLDEYAAFVRALVERYDGDGQEDMPGLLYPVHNYGIEREFTGYWPSGDPYDYVRLLRIAYDEIHTADPQAEVILVALLMADVFDGNPTPAEVERRLNQPKILSFSLDAIDTILAACDAYDMVDFHSLANYTEILPTTAWIRNRLTALGCEQKPIWIGDAFSMSALIGYGDPFGIVQPRPFAPASADNVADVISLLESVGNPGAADHTQASEWLYGQMAENLVKKIVVSAGEGLAGINVGNLEDWILINTPDLVAAQVRSFGTSTFMGMMDATLTNQHAADPWPGAATAAPLSRIRRPGNARPAFYALALTREKMGNYSSVESLDLGTGVWAYRFEMDRGPVWVLWYDDGELYLPGDDLPTIQVDLPIGAGSALLTLVPTRAKASTAEVIQAGAGTVSLTIGFTPVFVEPVE